MENHYTNIKSLIENTKDKIGKPVSSDVVSATIESFGIREKDTKDDFGFNSIKDLADLVYYELTTDKYYIGSTNQKTLAQRLGKHRGNYKEYLLDNTKTNVTSFKILQYNDHYIELLENYPCNNKEELLIRELYFIRLHDSIKNGLND